MVEIDLCYLHFKFVFLISIKSLFSTHFATPSLRPAWELLSASLDDR